MVLDQRINYIEDKLFLSILILTFASFEIYGNLTLCGTNKGLKLKHTIWVFMESL